MHVTGMLTFARSALIAVLLIALVNSTMAGVVHADGILRVKGGSWKNARVTLIPEFGAPHVIDRNSAHFTLDLALQCTYLLRAEHENAATKEVVFELRMPEQFAQLDYSFPFEITLEVEASENVSPFAGPVGLVSFEPALKDLSYTTDHRLLAIGNKARELAAKVRYAEPLARPELALEPTPGIPMPAKVPDSAAPLLDVTGLAAGAPNPLPSRTSPPVLVEPALPMSNDRIVTATAATSSARAVKNKVAPAVPSASVALKATCGQEELQHLPSMMIAIRYDSNCDELRKVTHSYGAVFYFQNGRAICQREYEQLLQH